MRNRRRQLPVKHLAILLAFLAGLWVLPEAAAQTVTFSRVTGVTEGDSGQTEVVFTVSMSQRPFFTTTITFLICDGTATGGEDYEPFAGLPGQALDDRANRQVSMRFTRTNWRPKTIRVPVYGDSKDEPDETIIGCLAGRGVPEGHRGIATIQDNDPAPRVTLLLSQYWITESGAGNSADVTARLSHPSSEDTRVTVAVESEEVRLSSNRTLTIAAGSTDSTGVVEVTAVDDYLYGDRSVTISGSASNSQGITQPSDVVLTITNDDLAHIQIHDAQAEEGDGGAADLDFKVTLAPAIDFEVRVSYATADGTASAGSDYEAASGALRFAPGETEKTVSVPVLGDTRPEADETFRVTLSSPRNAELARVQATGVIVNDDRVLASIADARMQEGDSGMANLDFRVTLSEASEAEVRLSYATADGTASAGSDYEAASGELRFAPGETEKTVSVPVLGDTRPEADETFTVTLSAPGNAELDRSRATGVIVNDDRTLASIADARAEEGDGGASSLDFRVTLSAASDLEVRLSYATADGTASAGSDYEAASGELRFAPGETEKTVSVPVLGDTRPEADETFRVTLGSPSNAELGRAQATGVIVNDDRTLASIADARAEEGDGGASSLDFRVTLSVASDLEVRLSYATADGTASAGSDYEAASGELRFAPGETEKTVSVSVLGDTRPEADETFRVALGSPSNAELGRAQATGVIVNDDRALASVADARAEEGDSGMAGLDFRVTLSVASDLEVRLSYATADGTASAGSDYEAASGELRFAPGETEKTVSVPVLGDTRPEADETFRVALDSPSNAELSRMTATGVIVDDDMAEARDRALEVSLASFGRILSRDAMNAISERFGETPAARGSQLVLGGQRLLSGSEETPFADQFTGWNHALANNFAAPGFRALHDLAEPGSNGPWRSSQLSLGDFLQQSSFNLAMAEGSEGADDGWNLSFWGRASSGRFSGQPLTGLSSDGDLVTGYLGMDAKVGERLLAGVALAHSDGDIGYGISDFSGELDLSLTSVFPYINFQLSEKLEIWSMMGVGGGKGEFRDAVRLGQTELQSAQGELDLGMSMVAAGANRALATWRDLNFELKTDAFAMFMKGDPEGIEAQPEVKARAQGVRLKLAGSTELMASEQGRLEVNLEFGGRWDGGDAQTGLGTEIGGGLDYRHADLGLGVAMQGQYLLFHEAQSFEEKGVSLTLEFDPGVQGRGFSLALRPAWGAYPGGTGALWNDEALLLMGLGGTAPQQTGLDMASQRLDLEWGYGFGLREGAGLLRLQGAMSRQGMGQRGYRFGGFLDVPGRSRVSLELNRQEGLGKPNHAFLLRWEHQM